MDDSSIQNTAKEPFFSSPRGKQVALWLAYFFFWGGAAAFLPYISLHYENVQLSGTQIGRLLSIPFFITLISSVTFGFISDTSRRNRLLLRISAIFLIAILVVFPGAQTYWMLFAAALVYSIFNAPINPILDDTTLNTLARPENYGKVRLGGSIGWGLVVLLTGFLIDNLGLGIQIIFIIHIVLLLPFLLIIGIIPTPRKQTTDKIQKPTLKSLGKMIANPRIFLLFLVIIIWGMGEASISNFLFLHIKHLGGSSTLMGTALSISLVGEILTFNFANRIQKKIGEFRMVLLAFVVLIIWLIGLSLIKDPQLIPAFQIFGGAGYALMQSGSVAYINRKAPPELGTTAQALRGGLYAGLGNGVGTIISGILYEFYGSSTMYLIVAVAQVCGFAFGILVYLRDRRNRAKKIKN